MVQYERCVFQMVQLNVGLVNNKIFYCVLRASERKTTLLIMSPPFIITGKVAKVSFQRKMYSWVTTQFRPEKFHVQKCTKGLLSLL
jgi:hypothetical protein